MSEHDRIHVTAEEGRLILAPSEPIVFQTVGIRLRSVQRILEAHQLAPHRIRTFKLSNDPKFADKLRDVVGLYVDLPAHAVVLSVDEKSQIPLPKNMGGGRGAAAAGPPCHAEQLAVRHPARSVRPTRFGVLLPDEAGGSRERIGRPKHEAGRRKTTWLNIPSALRVGPAFDP
jgi:hypothetical protein